MKYFFITVLVLVVLGVLLLGSVWVAGPHLFALDNHKNILFVSSEIDSSESQIYLVYFFPATQEVTVSVIQSGQVSVLGGYGDYELKKVLPLLTMERKKTDFKLAAMSWGMEAFIDHIVEIKSVTHIETKKQLQQQLWLAVLSHLTTPKELVELAKAFFFIKTVPIEQVTFVQHLTPVSQLDMLDDVVLYENCNVAVVNTTQKAGLASKMTRIIEKNGAVVVRITDQTSPYQLSTFSFDATHGSCQSLSERLQVLFPHQVVKKNHNQLQQEYRADLIIFIGNDLAHLM